MKAKPLKDVKVLDLTSVVVGPVCTWRLAQYGAEIIKVESPEGDLMRGLGGLSPTGCHSGTYLHLNSDKRNICLDLKSPGSQQVVEKLISSADVVIANMRPQALERLGIDAATILHKFPRKIYCLITGYGTDGPYAGQPTYDSVVQAATGMTGLALARDGAPRYVPMLICDHVVGEITAGAVLAAILKRDKTGEGSEIEVPMFETMSAFVLQEHMAQASFDPPVGPAGDQRLLSSYNQPVRTDDGWISFTINTDSQVKAFLNAIGRKDLLEDSRFSSVSARAKHVSEWFEIRGAPLLGKTTEQWLAIFHSTDIAAKPCHTLATLPNDPHLKAVELVNYQSHPTEGTVAVIRSTIRIDGQYAVPERLAQPKGWETETILSELGFQPDEIQALIAEKAIIQAPR